MKAETKRGVFRLIDGRLLCFPFGESAEYSKERSISFLCLYCQIMLTRSGGRIIMMLFSKTSFDRRNKK